MVGEEKGRRKNKEKANVVKTLANNMEEGYTGIFCTILVNFLKVYNWVKMKS